MSLVAFVSLKTSKSLLRTGNRRLSALDINEELIGSDIFLKVHIVSTLWIPTFQRLDTLCLLQVLLSFPLFLLFELFNEAGLTIEEVTAPHLSTLHPIAFQFAVIVRLIELVAYFGLRVLVQRLHTVLGLVCPLVFILRCGTHSVAYNLLPGHSIIPKVQLVGLQMPLVRMVVTRCWVVRCIALLYTIKLVSTHVPKKVVGLIHWVLFVNQLLTFKHFHMLLAKLNLRTLPLLNFLKTGFHVFVLLLCDIHVTIFLNICF